MKSNKGIPAGAWFADQSFAGRIEPEAEPLPTLQPITRRCVPLSAPEYANNVRVFKGSGTVDNPYVPHTLKEVTTEFAAAVAEPTNVAGGWIYQHGPAPTRLSVCKQESVGHIMELADAWFFHADRIQILQRGEWRDVLEAEHEQAAADHDEWARDFSAELQATTEDGE